MISRASLSSVQQFRNLAAISIRSAASSPVSAAPAKSDDCSTFKRPVRLEPGKVRLGFIPEEWFTFFYKKTGVTGPYTFAVALSTYLVSKEIYVMEHEYYSGLSLLILCVLGVKKLGPAIAKALDKEIDDYETSWNEGRSEEKKMLEEQIQDEEKLQWSSEGQSMLVTAKRENVALQLEASYRSRILAAYEEVKKRLDYQVEIQNIERRVAQKNLVDFVVTRVMGSITPDQEKQNIDKCISDLGQLARA